MLNKWHDLHHDLHHFLSQDKHLDSHYKNLSGFPSEQERFNTNFSMLGHKIICHRFSVNWISVRCMLLLDFDLCQDTSYSKRSTSARISNFIFIIVYQKQTWIPAYLVEFWVGTTVIPCTKILPSNLPLLLSFFSGESLLMILITASHVNIKECKS